MTSNRNKVRSTKGFKPTPSNRISPATRAIADVGDDYYSIAAAAEIIGMHTSTVRRLLATDRVKAPSSVLPQGKNHIWLLTEDDLVEVGRHFNATTALRRHFKAKYDGAIPLHLEHLINEEEE